MVTGGDNYICQFRRAHSATLDHGTKEVHQAIVEAVIVAEYQRHCQLAASKQTLELRTAHTHASKYGCTHYEVVHTPDAT